MDKLSPLTKRDEFGGLLYLDDILKYPTSKRAQCPITGKASPPPKNFIDAHAYKYTWATKNGRVEVSYLLL